MVLQVSRRDNGAVSVERFLNDVSEHKLTVIREDGLYRHLRLSKGSYCMQFDIVTFPGHLVFCGDLGTYVWSRLPDMFQFFRGRLTDGVDLGYLREKCEAADKDSGIMQDVDPDEFVQLCRNIVKQDEDDDDTDEQKAKRQRLLDELLDELRLCDTHEQRCDVVREATELLGHDAWEYFSWFRKYTLRFAWAALAVPWAITQYDEHRAADAKA